MIYGESFEEADFNASNAYVGGRAVGCGIAKAPARPGPGPSPTPVPPGAGCEVKQLTNNTSKLNPYCQHNAVVFTGGHCMYKCPSGDERSVSCQVHGHWASTVKALCSHVRSTQLATASGPISAMWRGFALGGAAANFSIVTDGVIHGRQAQRVTFAARSEDGKNSAAGTVGLTNHGLDCQWGLHLKAAAYDGYFWARVPSSSSAGLSAPVEVSVALIEFDSLSHEMGAVLSEATTSLSSGSTWTRYNFSLTPSAGTDCSTIRSNVSGHDQQESVGW